MIFINHFGDGTVTLLVPAEDVTALQEVFARACNCWPDAPPEVKELHDKLIHGAPLQDYCSQEDKKSSKV